MTSTPGDLRDTSPGRISATLRRAHHKSKLGCKSCKKRRVKCDERLPCANCLKRGIECSLLTLNPSLPWTQSTVHVFRVDQNPQVLKCSTIHSIPVPSFFEALTQEGLLDVPVMLQPQFKRILHHLCSVTMETIAPTQQALSAYHSALPNLVIQHPYVLKGFLSMASLHLSCILTDDSERKYHATLATGQLNIGLIQFRTALQNITSANGEGLLAFSTAISTFSLVTSGADCKNLLKGVKSSNSADHIQRTIKDLVDIVVRLMHSLRGVLVILVPLWYQLRDGSLSSLIERDWWPESVPTDPLAIEEDLKIQSLERMWMKPGRGYEYCFNTLASALKQLRDNFALVSRLTDKSSGTITDRTAVMVWPIQISSDFVALLEQRRPEAWVIIAHYAILHHRVTRNKEAWWLQDLSPSLVATATLILGEGYTSFMEWPTSELGLNVGSNRGTVKDCITG